MRSLILAAFILVLLENLAMADLVPATSEDLNDFDRQISLSQAKDSGTVSGRSAGSTKGAQKTKKASFGAAVSAEAKSLKDLPQDQHQGLGKWVSDQRKQNDQNQAGAGTNNVGSVGAGSTNDARNSSPANNNAGGNGQGNKKAK